MGEDVEPPPNSVLKFGAGGWYGEDAMVIIRGVTEQAMQREVQRYLANEGRGQSLSQAYRTVHTVAYWHTYRVPDRGDINVVPRVSQQGGQGNGISIEWQ